MRHSIRGVGTGFDPRRSGTCLRRRPSASRFLGECSCGQAREHATPSVTPAVDDERAYPPMLDSLPQCPKQASRRVATTRTLTLMVGEPVAETRPDPPRSETRSTSMTAEPVARRTRRADANRGGVPGVFELATTWTAASPAQPNRWTSGASKPADLQRFRSKRAARSSNSVPPY